MSTRDRFSGARSTSSRPSPPSDSGISTMVASGWLRASPLAMARQTPSAGRASLKESQATRMFMAAAYTGSGQACETDRRPGSVALEILDFALVPFGGGAAVEGAQVAALAGLGVLLAGIKPVFAG